MVYYSGGGGRTYTTAAQATATGGTGAAVSTPAYSGGTAAPSAPAPSGGGTTTRVIYAPSPTGIGDVPVTQIVTEPSGKQTITEYGAGGQPSTQKVLSFAEVQKSGITEIEGAGLLTTEQKGVIGLDVGYMSPALIQKISTLPPAEKERFIKTLQKEGQLSFFPTETKVTQPFTSYTEAGEAVIVPEATWQHYTTPVKVGEVSTLEIAGATSIAAAPQPQEWFIEGTTREGKPYKTVGSKKYVEETAMGFELAKQQPAEAKKRIGFTGAFGSFGTTGTFEIKEEYKPKTLLGTIPFLRRLEGDQDRLELKPYTKEYREHQISKEAQRIAKQREAFYETPVFKWFEQARQETIEKKEPIPRFILDVTAGTLAFFPELAFSAAKAGVVGSMAIEGGEYKLGAKEALKEARKETIKVFKKPETYVTAGVLGLIPVATGYAFGKRATAKGKAITPKIETAADITYRETLAGEGKAFAVEQTATEGRISYELKGKPIKELPFRSGTVAETGIIKTEAGASLEFKGTQITELKAPKGAEMLKTEFAGGGKIIETKAMPEFDISIIGKTEIGKMPPTEWKTIIDKGKPAGVAEVPKFSEFKPTKAIETSGLAKGKMEFEIKAEGQPTIQEWKFAEITSPLKETKIQPKATAGISIGAIGEAKEVTLIGGKKATITKELWLGKREMAQGDIGLSYKEAFKAAYERETYKPAPFIPPKPIKPSGEYPFKWMAEKPSVKPSAKLETVFEQPKQIETPSLLQASKEFRAEPLKQRAEQLLPEIRKEYAAGIAQKGKQIGIMAGIIQEPISQIRLITPPKAKQEFKFQQKQEIIPIGSFIPITKIELLPQAKIKPETIPQAIPLIEQLPEQIQKPFQLITPETISPTPPTFKPTPPIITVMRPSIPTPAFRLPQIEGAEQPQRKPFKAGKRPFKYAPSLAGVYMGATIKKAPKEYFRKTSKKAQRPSGATGFEIRPVVGKRRGKSLMDIFGRR